MRGCLTPTFSSSQKEKAGPQGLEEAYPPCTLSAWPWSSPPGRHFGSPRALGCRGVAPWSRGSGGGLPGLASSSVQFRSSRTKLPAPGPKELGGMLQSPSYLQSDRQQPWRSLWLRLCLLPPCPELLGTSQGFFFDPHLPPLESALSKCGKELPPACASVSLLAGCLRSQLQRPSSQLPL